MCVLNHPKNSLALIQGHVSAAAGSKKKSRRNVGKASLELADGSHVGGHYKN